MSQLYPVKCPGMIYKFNHETGKKEYTKCNALLFKLNEGGKCETICRRCKSKITTVVRQTFGQDVIIDVKQEPNNE